MTLGNHLFNARKHSGLSQEDVAEKLGVSRQTISKWESDETLPDIRQSQEMAVLYHLSLDELIEFNIEVKKIEQTILDTSEETQQKINWTKLWGQKYPILTTYKQQVKTSDYTVPLKNMLHQLKQQYGYNDIDAFLVLKDILAQMWNNTEH